MKDLSIITPIIAEDINYKFLRLYRSINNQNIIRKISWILVGDRNACIKFKKLNLKSNKIKITFLTKSCNMAEATNFAIKKIKTDFWLSIGYDDQFIYLNWQKDKKKFKDKLLIQDGPNKALKVSLATSDTLTLYPSKKYLSYWLYGKERLVYFCKDIDLK